jgi:ketosteroid isomerase-like protein
MKLLDNLCMLIMLQFCEAYTNRDLDKLLSLFTQNATMFGTGVDEYRTGLKEIEEQVKRDWSQSEKGEVKLTSFLGPSGNSTWGSGEFTAKIQIDGKIHTFEPLRGTIILEQEDGTWKIAHMHASFPDYSQAEGASFPNR